MTSAEGSRGSFFFERKRMKTKKATSTTGRGKKFTPRLIASIIAAGRGRGVHASYHSFHTVERPHPGSIGTSSRDPKTWSTSISELLSHVEQRLLSMAAYLQDVDDLRTQYYLLPLHHLNELTDYLEDVPMELFEGTTDICTRLGIKHPICRAGKDTCLWPITTDLVITF